MENAFTPAYCRFGISRRLGKQLTADFLLGHRFALHEFLHLLEILAGIECKTDPFAAVTAAPPRFLIVAFQRFRHIIMDHIADIGFVYTHAESYRSHNNIYFLKQKSVLIGASGSAVHTGMISKGADIVHPQQLGEFFHFFS